MKSEPQRLQDVAYSVLAEHLDQGKLPPGARLRETELARQFGISRVPVRAALKRLEDEGRLIFHGRQGYTVPGDPAMHEGRSAALVIPEAARDELETRNWRQRLFDEVETAVASAMVFGRFGVNEKAMAEHYGVGRGVAHEIITRMERVGLVRQQPNGRWQLGSMTEEDVREHYAMRCLLEPVALVEAAPKIPARRIRAQIRQLKALSADIAVVGTRELLAIERWLHCDIVLACGNRVLAEVIKRSQLPLISTHIAFTATRSEASVRDTIEQHLEVLVALDGGDLPAAAAALAAHLGQAAAVTGSRIQRLPPPDFPASLPFLTMIEQLPVAEPPR